MKSDNELIALNDIISFCEGRLRLTISKEVKTGYRDVKFLARQHRNLIKGDTMKGTNFRIYPDGRLVHEDNFKKDKETGYTLFLIPDIITAYIIAEQERYQCSFCGEHKKGKLVGGPAGRICFDCIKEKKKELDKEEGNE